MSEAKSFFDRSMTWLGFRKTEQQQTRAPRADFLQNSFLGYGTDRDKLSFGGFSSSLELTNFELNALYYFDDIGAKIVNKRPAEMLRKGYHLVSKKNPTRAADIQKAGEALNLDWHLLRGKQWGRLWGGALTIFGALDGSTSLDTPLNPSTVRDLSYLNTIDRRIIAVKKWQDDPKQPGYQLPLIYSVGTISDGIAGGSTSTDVHVSRVIRYDGVDETDPITRRRLGGWTYSALQRPYDIIRDFATAYKSVAHLISDASQGVWKIEGLLDMIANNRDELITRMQFSDMTRSAGRAIMLDPSEDFTRVATSFSGLDAVLDRLMMRLSAASGMPVTELMGRSAAGMNATGDGDKRSWYDELATDQKNELRPIILGAYKLIGSVGGGAVPDDLDVEFCPLWEPTAQEKAQTDKLIADTDAVYVGMGLPAESVFIARFGSGEGKIEIDEDAMRVSLDHEIELMKDPEARAQQEALANQAAIAKANPKGQGPQGDAPDADAKNEPDPNDPGEG